MTLPTILAFDTSGPFCAVAVMKAGELLTHGHEDMKRGQAERLLPLIQEQMTTAKIGWSDLDLIAVGIGPGNFTGIRIGVSAARGMALARNIPAMGISQFEIQRGPDSPHQLDPDRIIVAGPRHIAYVQEFLDGRPIATPSLLENENLDQDPVPHPAPIIAAIASARWGLGETCPDRPAPLYVRAADAAPPRDPAPVIIS